MITNHQVRHIKINQYNISCYVRLTQNASNCTAYVLFIAVPLIVNDRNNFHPRYDQNLSIFQGAWLFQKNMSLIKSVPRRPNHFLKIQYQIHLFHFKVLTIMLQKNAAYGRQRISRPMRIVGPIQFWRGCVIYLKKK